MTTLYTNETEHFHLSNFPKIYVMNREYTKINFQTTEDLMINCINFNGKAEIYWETEPENRKMISLKDEQLSLTSSIIETENKENDIKRKKSSLIIHNMLIYLKAKKLQPQFFGLYINFNKRPKKINFDLLPVGKSIKYSYRNSDFPINLFSKLSNETKNINLFMRFEELVSDIKFDNYDNLFDIYSVIVNESYINDIKKQNIIPNLNNFPNYIKGKFYSGVNGVLINFNINEIKINKLQNDQFIIFQILKNKNINYNRISLETTLFEENSFISENIYQYDKLNNNNDIKIYKLKLDKIRHVIRIEFSSNSPNINWAINRIKGQKINDTFYLMSSRYMNGRSYMSFKFRKQEDINVIYLTVFYNSNKINSEIKNNYVFKYMNSDSDNDKNKFKIPDGSLKLIKSNETNYLILNPVISNKEFNITYSVKYIPSNINKIQEILNTISFTESNFIVTTFENPEIINEKIKLNISLNLKNISLIQVIAKIIDEDANTVFLSYDYLILNKENLNIKSESFLVFYIIAFIVIIIIIIIIVIFKVINNSKNVDLLNKVSSISFQDDRNGEIKLDDNQGLLLSDD